MHDFLVLDGVPFFFFASSSLSSFLVVCYVVPVVHIIISVQYLWYHDVCHVFFFFDFFFFSFWDLELIVFIFITYHTRILFTMSGY